MDILEGLNSAQLEAVTSTEGCIRVVAGAGSGKTRALTRRFAYLVNEAGIMPGNILCVTFTNKAAAEMRQRIHQLTGDNDTGYINTFHGFCVAVLKEDGNAVQYPKSFLVLDNSDIDSMLRIIYEERELTLRDMTFSAARDMIEMQKLRFCPEYYHDLINMSLDELREKYLKATGAADIIFYGYLYQQKKCFGLDYNDLLKFTIHIFELDRTVRLRWQERLEYIMIDEFQDIDMIQYQLMEILAGYHKNLFVVGDPDQTIYTWRGANVKYLLDFDKRFPGTRTIMMNQNYRSSPEIIAAANSLIAANRTRMKKELVAMRGSGPAVICHHAEDEAHEAERIAREIGRLRDAGQNYRSMAILYRAHYVTRSIEQALVKQKIPYTIYSGLPFFERAEIKDALSYLRMMTYRDDLSFARIINRPKRNMGARRMQFLTQTAERLGCSLYRALQLTLGDAVFRGTQAARFVDLVERFSSALCAGSVSETLSAILDESGYEAALRTEGSQTRLDNLAELKQSVYEFESQSGEEVTAEHYLQHAALFTNADLSEKDDRVKLMTVHAAKGLEFEHVFLAALNEGIFPSKKTKTLAGMEEERRLAFVAMTRARDSLFLSESAGRNQDGSTRYPSRFILDIGKGLITFDPELTDGFLDDARRFVSYRSTHLVDEEGTSVFEVGDSVRHPVFGIGTIELIDTEHQAYVIRFPGMMTPRRIAFTAKLAAV